MAFVWDCYVLCLPLHQVSPFVTRCPHKYISSQVYFSYKALVLFVHGIVTTRTRHSYSSYKALVLSLQGIYIHLSCPLLVTPCPCRRPDVPCSWCMIIADGGGSTAILQPQGAQWDMRINCGKLQNCSRKNKKCVLWGGCSLFNQTRNILYHLTFHLKYLPHCPFLGFVSTLPLFL